MLIMGGIDYSLASVEVREKFSFTKAFQTEIYRTIKQEKGVLGGVIVSTCNRTELYISCDEGYCVDPFLLLCSIINVNPNEYPHIKREGEMLFLHLCRLACGAKSQIWGEDQIISQVKNSISLAREENASDNKLEVLFRTAITCAKKIKTQIKFSKSEGSIALKSLEILKKHKNIGNNVLVIGNGEVGRLMAQTLLQNGFNVTMTIREYKHGEVVLPDRVRGIDYKNRYERLNEFDILISATLSPHYTLEKDKLITLANFPKVMLDLAVPRDIEPSIAEIFGVCLYDIDSIGRDIIEENHFEQLSQIDEIIEKHYADYKKWCSHSEEMHFNAVQKKKYFPLFTNISKKTVLIVGAGKVAQRRIETLQNFDCIIKVVAPCATDKILKLSRDNKIEYHCKRFEKDDLNGVFIAVAATNERETNNAIGLLAKQNGIYVSVADCMEECSFFFPAIAIDDDNDVVIGISAEGKNHSALKKTAQQIRKYIENEDLIC